MDELLQRIPYTIMLAVAASAIMILVAIPLGVIAALKQNSLFDSASMAFCLMGVAMPPFWLGLLLMLLFSVKLDWVPSSGAETWTCLILPALTQCVAGMASVGRVTRSSMLEVIRQDYIRTARAKGQTEKVVIYKHALKNALIPVITVLGLQFGAGLGGAVVTETVFSIPGLGKLMVDAINARNYPMVQGGVLVIACVFTLVNLAVDVLYAYLDPRIKSQYGGKVKAKKLIKEPASKGGAAA
jgi:peptide/nickel transport system permease protein